MTAPTLERPIFIVSTPRSGSTLLFETLSQAPGLYTVGGESHRLIESIPSLTPAGHGWHSNRLTAEDATSSAIGQLSTNFYEQLRDREGAKAEGGVRMLEKTPKNALRVPFFASAWPDATFVYLYRDPRQTLASMIEAWRSGRFRTYPGLPDWNGPTWSLLLIPGWQRLSGASLARIVATQWTTTTNILIDDLSALPPDHVCALDYREFVASPQAQMLALANALGLGWDRKLTAQLPYSVHTVSRPNADKWRAIEDLIEEVWPLVEEADANARAFLEQARLKA